MEWGRIFLSVSLAAFGVAAIGNGLDRISREIPTLERAVPRPFRAQADRSAAVVALSRQELLSAAKHARASVLHDPVDPDSTALLGSALLVNGKNVEADAAFRIAARFGWRNVATQVYWFQAALEASEYAVAADRADAILRSHPAYPQRNALLAPLESDPSGRLILARHLRQAPEWLPYYLDVASDVPADVAERGQAADLVKRRLDVLALAITDKFHFDCAALGNPITRLIRIGRYEDARTLWNRNCPQTAIPQGVVDASFALLAKNQASPFGWQPYFSGDVSISFEGSGVDRRMVLANQGPIGHVVLQQPIALPAGTYRVSIDGNAAAVAAAALSWKCDDQGTGALTTGSLAQNGRMIKVGDCSRQLLGLWLPAHTSALSFREVRLLPLGSSDGGS